MVGVGQRGGGGMGTWNNQHTDLGRGPEELQRYRGISDVIKEKLH